MKQLYNPVKIRNNFLTSNFKGVKKQFEYQNIIL